MESRSSFVMNWPCAALPEAELASRTTLRVGGRAEWLLEPSTPDELREAWQAARERGFMPRLMGGGANLVIDDGLLPGVVIATARMNRTFRPMDIGTGPEEFEKSPPTGDIAPPDPAKDPRLVAWAGVPLPGLVRTTRGLGFSGLEGLGGIPGQLGGGVAMNAGGRWGDIWSVIEHVRLLDSDGEYVDLSAADAAPRYRDGNLDGRVVVGAVMRFEVLPKPVVAQRVKEWIQEKNKVQPVSEHSAGCMFKNPDPELSDGRGAGLLVDQAGLLGLTQGGAMISTRHGNFLINSGGAKAADVLALMESVRAKVADHHGVELEYEVKRWRAES